MYKPIIKLNTNICRVCDKIFYDEKCLKYHIFNRRINDFKHVKFKNEIREKIFENAKLFCPVCNQKIFRATGNHFKHAKNLEHTKFLQKQKRFIIINFYNSKSALDIARINSIYTENFSEKYIINCIIHSIGKNKYSQITKNIFSEKRRIYWDKISEDERRNIMLKVREAQWGSLSDNDKKNHPWVLSGRKASLSSSIKGSKNQMYAYKTLIKEIPEFDWKYNYVINNNWQVDIASPKNRIYIEWDGRHHRIPIHGESCLNNRINRDHVKNKIIVGSLKGLMIRVKDDGRENKKFVEDKISIIKQLILTIKPFRVVPNTLVAI